ncbi:Protein of unknown function (DUF2810) [Spongiibacter sp. IMCC21906]|uniref:YibL family ribosome-associated protein n=1 Tax=Spongiibacter sp. IMCC21906 TaxID=1620392 RepID=UPI00062DE22D|nr:YibL family ribosome-associated protein [Spongiibacter sp. IMCC21906]AKH69940.1 Protein of unknown function (DUF2810) [Spongiibacter sp. IMCC21906]
MSTSKELQTLNNKLDLLRRKLADVEQTGNVPLMRKFSRDISKLQRQIGSIKGMRSQRNADEGASLKAMKFSRSLTKLEQADMGKFKKSVKGLVVVHPLTALGKEMGLTEVTGYAPVEF